MSKYYDVVIAGGGVIGASCAYQLSKRKDLRVALIDAKRPGNASRASAGGLWAIGESVGLGCGVIFFRMMSANRKREAQGSAVVVDSSTPHILPQSFFDFALQSNELYPRLHRELIGLHGMDFKFEQTGLKFVIYDDEDRLYAEHIVGCIPHLSDQVRWLDQAALRAAEPKVSHEAQGALEFLCDHQVNPFRLTDAYTEGARQNGVDVYFNTNVNEVLHQGTRVRGVRTDAAGLFSCDTLINATGAWAATTGAGWLSTTTGAGLGALIPADSICACQASTRRSKLVCTRGGGSRSKAAFQRDTSAGRSAVRISGGMLMPRPPPDGSGRPERPLPRNDEHSDPGACVANR